MSEFNCGFIAGVLLIIGITGVVYGIACLIDAYKKRREEISDLKFRLFEERNARKLMDYKIMDYVQKHLETKENEEETKED